jgi:hypothetical protein
MLLSFFKLITFGYIIPNQKKIQILLKFFLNKPINAKQNIGEYHGNKCIQEHSASDKYTRSKKLSTIQ